MEMDNNSGGGKIRTKRSHGPSKPYETRRKSFFGRVTDTVRDILAPSWLSTFMPSVKKKPNDDDDDDEAAAAVEEEEEENEEFLCSLQNSRNFDASNLSKQPPLHTSQSSSGVSGTNFQFSVPIKCRRVDEGLEYVMPHAPQNAHSYSFINGGKSTSAMSNNKSTTTNLSMLPDMDSSQHQRDGLSLRRVGLNQLKHRLQEANEIPAVVEKKPLLSTKLDEAAVWNEDEQQCYDASLLHHITSVRSRNSPLFNVSLFGSPLMNNKSLLNDSLHESSFYNGKTRYGGASDNRKNRQMKAFPYQSTLPLRKQIKAKPVNTNKAAAITSSATRRILNALETMATPLSDAKKIPVNDNFPDSVLSFTPSSFQRRKMADSRPVLSKHSYKLPSPGPPTKMINSPAIASIAKNRQFLKSSTKRDAPKVKENVKDKESVQTNAAEEKKLLELEASFQQSPSTSVDNGSGLKMKRDKSYVNRRVPAVQEVELEAPKLDTAFTLPVKNMPRFDFNPSVVPDTSVLNTTRSSLSGYCSANDYHSSDPKFTFSSPIQKPSPALNTSSTSLSPDFTFRSPIRIEESKHSIEQADKLQESKQSADANFVYNSGSAAPKAREYPCKATEENSCAMKPATKLKAGSVMEILGRQSADAKTADETDAPEIRRSKEIKQQDRQDGKEELDKSDSLVDKFRRPAGFWDCDTCLLQNDASASKCVACQTPKPSPAVPVQNLEPLMAKFKKPPGTWDCDTCLLQNKPENSVCVACQSAKPSTNAALAVPKAEPLQVKFKKPDGIWDCETCLLQNKNSEAKCVACLSPRPKVLSQAIPNPEPLITKFSRPPGVWDCDICLLQNQNTEAKCLACQTPKPGIAATGVLALADPQDCSLGKSVGRGRYVTNMVKKPVDIWKCDTCLVSNRPEFINCIACDTPFFKPAVIATIEADLKGSADVLPSNSSDNSKAAFTFVNKDKKSSKDFIFGSSKTPPGNEEMSAINQKPAASGGFSFGKASKPQESGFVFGNVLKTSKSNNADSPKFVFGTLNTSQKSAESSGKGFVFGKSDGKQKDANITSEKSSVTGFLFSKDPKTSDCQISGNSDVFGKTEVDLLGEGFTYKEVGSGRKLKDSVMLSERSVGGFEFKKEAKKDSKMSDFTFGETDTTAKPIDSMGTNLVFKRQPDSSIGSSAFTFAKTSSTETTTVSRLPFSDLVNDSGAFSFSQKGESQDATGHSLQTGTAEKSNKTSPAAQNMIAGTFSTGITSSASVSLGLPNSGTQSDEPKSRDSPSTEVEKNDTSKSVFGGFGAKSFGTFNFTTPVVTSSAGGLGVGSTLQSKMHFDFQAKPDSTTDSALPIKRSLVHTGQDGSGKLPSFNSSFGTETTKTAGTANSSVSRSPFTFTNPVATISSSLPFGSSSTTKTTPAFGGSPITGAAFSFAAVPAATDSPIPKAHSGQSSAITFGSGPPAFGSSSTDNKFGGSSFGNSSSAFGGTTVSATFGSTPVSTFGNQVVAATTSGAFPPFNTTSFNFSSGTQSGGVFQFTAKTQAGNSVPPSGPGQNSIFHFGQLPPDKTPTPFGPTNTKFGIDVAANCTSGDNSGKRIIKKAVRRKQHK